jgi:hypothetical protein
VRRLAGDEAPDIAGTEFEMDEVHGTGTLDMSRALVPFIEEGGTVAVG